MRNLFLFLDKCWDMPDIPYQPERYPRYARTRDRQIQKAEFWNLIAKTMLLVSLILILAFIQNTDKPLHLVLGILIAPCAWLVGRYMRFVIRRNLRRLKREKQFNEERTNHEV